MRITLRRLVSLVWPAPPPPRPVITVRQPIGPFVVEEVPKASPETPAATPDRDLDTPALVFSSSSSASSWRPQTPDGVTTLPIDGAGDDDHLPTNNKHPSPPPTIIVIDTDAPPPNLRATASWGTAAKVKKLAKPARPQAFYQKDAPTVVAKKTRRPKFLGTTLKTSDFVLATAAGLKAVEYKNTKYPLPPVTSGFQTTPPNTYLFRAYALGQVSAHTFDEYNKASVAGMVLRQNGMSPSESRVTLDAVFPILGEEFPSQVRLQHAVARVHVLERAVHLAMEDRQSARRTIANWPAPLHLKLLLEERVVDHTLDVLPRLHKDIDESFKIINKVIDEYASLDTQLGPAMLRLATDAALQDACNLPNLKPLLQSLHGDPFECNGMSFTVTLPSEGVLIRPTIDSIKILGLLEEEWVTLDATHVAWAE